MTVKFEVQDGQIHVPLFYLTEVRDALEVILDLKRLLAGDLGLNISDVVVPMAMAAHGEEVVGAFGVVGDVDDPKEAWGELTLVTKSALVQATVELVSSSDSPAAAPEQSITQLSVTPIGEVVKLWLDADGTTRVGEAPCISFTVLMEGVAAHHPVADPEATRSVVPRLVQFSVNEGTCHDAAMCAKLYNHFMDRLVASGRA